MNFSGVKFHTLDSIQQQNEFFQLSTKTNQSNGFWLSSHQLQRKQPATSPKEIHDLLIMRSQARKAVWTDYTGCGKPNASTALRMNTRLQSSSLFDFKSKVYSQQVILSSSNREAPLLKIVSTVQIVFIEAVSSSMIRGQVNQHKGLPFCSYCYIIIITYIYIYRYL